MTEYIEHAQWETFLDDLVQKHHGFDARTKGAYHAHLTCARSHRL